MLKGNLSGFSLGEIFQSLSINRHTGTLTLHVAGSTKHIYFEQGDIRFFSHGSPKTPRIGEILLRSGALTQEQLESALVEAREKGRLVGRVLVDNGYVCEDDIRAALEMKVCEELFELFAFEEGDFEFNLDNCPDDIFDQLQRSVGIEINTNGVIMEGLRRLDEWQMIHDAIPSENQIFLGTDQALPAGSSAPVAEALELVNGVASVEEISRSHPGSKFDLMKALFDLLKAETIRPLSSGEAQSAGVAAKESGDFPRAATFLRFACELDPVNADLKVSLGECLAKFYQEQESQDAFVAALEIFHQTGDWHGAADTANKLPPSANLGADSLEQLVDTYVALGETKKAIWATQQVTGLLLRDGEVDHASRILESLVDIDPEDLNFRVQVATLFQQIGDNDRATDIYQDVADALEDQRKIKDQIKILKLVFELNPKQVEIKQKITTLTALQEKIERQRKRRLTFAGIGGILLLCCSVVPLIYEIKARELFSHARRMEEIALQNGDYTRAKMLFEELLQDYSMSSKADETKLTLDRIAQIEQNLESTLKSQLERKQREQAQQRRDLDNKIVATSNAAEEAAAKHDMDQAHELFRAAYELSKGSRNARKLQLPVLFDSSPRGAQVLVSGVAIGETPVVAQYTPGQEFEIKFSRKGCEDLEEVVKLDDQKIVHRSLTRRALAEIVLPSNFEQPVEGAERSNVFVFPSRDGHVYAYDPESSGVSLKKSVGAFGDRLSDLHLRNGYAYVGTVDNTLLSFHIKTGKRKWPARNIRGPIFAAPTTTADGRWLAVGNIRGEVFVLDNRNGRIEATFSTENEIVAAPLFTKNYLLVGCRDDYIYGFSIDSQRLEFLIELRGDVDADPIAFENDGVFATRDGRVHRVDTTVRNVRWSVKVTEREIQSLLATESSIYAAISTGEILRIDPKTGAVEDVWKLHDSAPGGMLVDRDILYVGYQSGYLAAWNTKTKNLDWSWQADASIQTPPVLLKRRLYVACNSGTVQVLELD